MSIQRSFIDVARLGLASMTDCTDALLEISARATASSNPNRWQELFFQPGTYRVRPNEITIGAQASWRGVNGRTSTFKAASGSTLGASDWLIRVGGTTGVNAPKVTGLGCVVDGTTRDNATGIGWRFHNAQRFFASDLYCAGFARGFDFEASYIGTAIGFDAQRCATGIRHGVSTLAITFIRALIEASGTGIDITEGQQNTYIGTISEGNLIGLSVSGGEGTVFQNTYMEFNDNGHVVVTGGDSLALIGGVMANGFNDEAVFIDLEGGTNTTIDRIRCLSTGGPPKDKFCLKVGAGAADTLVGRFQTVELTAGNMLDFVPSRDNASTTTRLISTALADVVT